MTNYKYLKENNLFEAHMRFMRALGESYSPYTPIEEADDDQNQDPMAGGADPNAMGGAPGGQDPTMGGGMPGGEDPMAGGGQDPNAMGGTPDGQDPMAGGGDMGGMPGGEDPMAGGADPMAPGPDMGGMEEAEPEEDENVIDVDDLTKAQEKTNDKVNAVGKDLGKVDTRIEKLLGAIDKLEDMFDKNNQDIESLRQEFEKRNPTQTEKLNLRSLDSYPFNAKPNEYWDNKAQNSNYSAYADNDEPTTQEYVITNNDVDDFTDSAVADSFNIPSDWEQDIKKIFGI